MYLARLLLLAAFAGVPFVATAGRQSEPGRFDYYAVALSWSPSYCATRNDPDQCPPAAARFVLHGLWPQYEKRLSERCSNQSCRRRSAHDTSPVPVAPAGRA